MSGLVTGGALLLWALGSGSGLRVETSTPDALCPDLGQVRAAARARLGDIEADGDWNASYALIHRPDGAESGDIVRLTLHDPAGRLRLQRELPRAGESCASLAQALVVILDAYFRHPTDTEELAAARAGARADGAGDGNRAPAGARRRNGWPWICRRGGRARGVAPTDKARCWRWDCERRWRRSGGPASRGRWLTSSVTQTFATPSGNVSASLRSYGLRGFVARDLLHGPRRPLARRARGDGRARSRRRGHAARRLSRNARFTRRRSARAASTASGASAVVVGARHARLHARRRGAARSRSPIRQPPSREPTTSFRHRACA